MFLTIHSEMTYESPQTRLFLQQYLLNQLVATNNVFVKIKVLKIFQVNISQNVVLGVFNSTILSCGSV